MQFPQALETVLETLGRMRDESGQHPCASRRALEALQKISPGRSVAMAEHAVDGGWTDSRATGVRVATRPQQSANANTDKLAAIKEKVCACVKCPNLANSRTQTVFGVGNPDADLM